MADEQIMSEKAAEAKWVARRKMALWSFRAIIGIFFALLLTAVFAPNGIQVLEAMTILISTTVPSLIAVVLAYFGVDGVERNKS